LHKLYSGDYMQFMWFFLSVFLGIIGGLTVLKMIYYAAVGKISDSYCKRKMKENNYGRRKS